MKKTDEIEVSIYTNVKVSLDDVIKGFVSHESKVEFLHGLFCLLKEHEWDAFFEMCNDGNLVSDWVIDNQTDSDYHLVYIPRDMPQLIDEVKKKIAIETKGDLYSLDDTK